MSQIRKKRDRPLCKNQYNVSVLYHILLLDSCSIIPLDKTAINTIALDKTAISSIALDNLKTAINIIAID